MDAELGDAWTGGDALTVGYRMTRYSRRAQPSPLSNGMYLNVEIALRLTREPRRVGTPVPTRRPSRRAGRSSPSGPLRIETRRATFTHQTGADNDDPSPVFTYHYERDSRSGYPSCHLHMHAEPEHYQPAAGNSRRKSFSRLHLPTRRLTLEQIVRHVIQEHGVESLGADWREVLRRGEL